MTGSTTTTFDFGSEELTGEELWSADFSAPEEFLCVSDGNNFEFRGDDLRIDLTGNGGATCWYPHEFPEDIIIQYQASVPEFRRTAAVGDDDFNGRNLNCLFATKGTDGETATIGERYRTEGADTGYRNFQNYFLTLTYKHTRMRKSPGGDLRSELLFGVDYPNHTYEVTILKRGTRIAAAVNGRVLHDWTDPDPLGSGWVGLVTWSTDVTFDHWAVYSPV